MNFKKGFPRLITVTFVVIVIAIILSIWGVYNATECSLIKCAAPIGDGSNCYQPAFCPVYISSLVIFYVLGILGIIISIIRWIIKKIKKEWCSQ